MVAGKVKSVRPRLPLEETPPSQKDRRRPRLASEPTSRRRRLADRWEEGFLRLHGYVGDHALSFVVDGLGIYYDATAPSELETLLQRGGWESPELLERADAGMDALRRRRLSLDNDPRRRALEDILGEPAHGTTRVVVVDQPHGDPSIGFGLAGAHRFATMLRAAVAENPGSEIVVVRDPAVRRPEIPGHLGALAREMGVRVVEEPVSAWSVAESCDRLYVVASHLGFEGAIAGRRVTCFGMPFYAGWGFTDDRLHLSRRTRRREVRDVFAAAYLNGSRYFEPYRGQPISFEEALDILDIVAERQRENAVDTLALGLSAWKRRWASQTLGAPGHALLLTRAAKVGSQEASGFARVVAWASREPEGAAAAARSAGAPLLRMEDGFIRSIGLGVGLRPGASYVLDGTGIYYDASAPSDLERLLEAGISDPVLLERAASLREAVVGAGLSKYNVGSTPPPVVPRDRPVVLVAGQVENDASIRLGSPDFQRNAELLRRARANNPGSFIVYKPHPDVEAGLRPGQIAPADLALADLVLRDVSAHRAIEIADRVEVMTSLIGFEALLRGKAVRTYGLPFYAGWGLTEDPGSPRRTRRLVLDELVAGALILYPRYLDPQTGIPCSPETLVERLGAGDPGLGRRERTPEALLKSVWSMAVRRARQG